MSKRNDGGPAFPVTPMNAAGPVADTFTGMSLRDYFAAAALHGLLASSQYPVDKDTGTTRFETYSACAYHHADAMLAERAK